MALAVVGDLQKNSLGLVWLAALLASLHAWRESESVDPRRAERLAGALLQPATFLQGRGPGGAAPPRPPGPPGPPGFALLLLVVAPSVPLLARGGHPILTDAALSELASLTACMEEPERSLVVARHGLEWWTAWSLRTHIAQPSAVQAADWSRYRQVFFLRQKGGSDTSIPVGLGPPPFEDPAIPRDALVVHDGPCFTLALVGAPAGGKEP